MSRPKEPTPAGARAGERPHAPRVGWARRVLGPLHFTGLFWYRFPLRIARITPEPLLRVLVPLFARLAVPVLGGVRRALASNLALALGPAGTFAQWGRVRRTLESFAWCIIERNEQFLPGRTFDVDIEGRGHWDALTGPGTGFILATAHVGNWELGSTVPVSKAGLVIHVVREAEGDADAQRYTEELLAGLGGIDYRTHFATDDVALGVELLAALREGEVVALQSDRPRSGGRTVAAPFLGTTLDMPVGLASLARLASAPVLPIFTLREGRRRYRVVVRPPIHPERTRDRDADERRLIESLAAELEGVVRRAPHQWFCFREIDQG